MLAKMFFSLKALHSIQRVLEVRKYYLCMDFEISDKTYLVTGGSGGIGLAIAKMLIEEGANVAIHYHSNFSSIEELQKEFSDNSNQIFPVQANITEELQVRSMFKLVSEKFGRIDGLVNNAGIWPAEDIPIHEMSLEHWNKTIQTNLTSYFLCTREFVNQLKKNSGDHASVVFIGSTAGIFGEAFHIDYSVSKAGLHGMMLSLKNELPRICKYGRSNIVSPGWTQTPMAEEGLENLNSVSKVLQTIALRKIASSEDIASIVCILLSDKLSGHVSGQNIAVTGGMEGRVLYNKDEVDPKNPLGYI